jgi:hypothetical protein
VDSEREAIRDRIIAEAWFLQPARALYLVARSIAQWLRHNRISFGFFVSWAERDDPEAAPGLRVAVLSVDSPRRAFVMGWTRIDRRDLLGLAANGLSLRLRVLGWLRISTDVDAELAERTLGSVRVIGVSHVPASVRQSLEARAA